MKTESFLIPTIRDPQQARIFSQRLKVLPHIVEALVDLASQKVTITYHEQFISSREITQLVSSYTQKQNDMPTLTGEEAYRVYEHKTKIKEEEKKGRR